MADWDLKIAALRSRIPGRGFSAIASSSAMATLLRTADKIAFANNNPLDSDETDEATLWQEPFTFQHPLTGELDTSTRTTSLYKLPWEVIARAHDQKINSLLASPALMGASSQNRYLALWDSLVQPPPAELLPSLSQEEYKCLRHCWTLLPAHPRVPATPIWHHLSLISALSGTAYPADFDSLPSFRPALLMVNIADAQPFIARARRTQDLWAGSYLLSFLGWQILRHLCDQFGPDCLISPDLRNQPLLQLWLQEKTNSGRNRISDEEAAIESAPLWVSSIPNFFTAVVPLDDVEEVVKAAVNAAFSTWDVIGEAVRRRLIAAAPSRWDTQCQAIWERQNQHFLRDNIFWQTVAWPTGSITLSEKSAFERIVRRILMPNPPRLPEALLKIASPDDRVDKSSPIEVAGAFYGDASRLAARLLADRKRLRDFAPLNEPGQKCTLSGLYQALSGSPPPHTPPLKNASLWWQEVVRQSAVNSSRYDGSYKIAGRFRRGEQLSAIYVVKRLALQAYFGSSDAKSGVPHLDRHQFPSTAGIANGRLIENLLQRCIVNEGLRNRAISWQRAIKGLLGNFYYPASRLPIWDRCLKEADDSRLEVALRDIAEVDGEFLYEEALDGESLANAYEGLSLDPVKLAQAVSALRGLLSAMRDEGIPPPTRYYAIVAMDGDSMGEWVSGQRGTMPLSPSLHQGLSSALSGFAHNEAQHIIEQKAAGKLIYAGGDDILALLPVVDLLPTMEALYGAFRGTEQPFNPSRPAPLNGAAFSGFVDGPSGREWRLGGLTLSAGVAIVHEAAPLTASIEAAWAAEEDAKEELGRDAFSVRLLRRGGAPITIGAKWRLCGLRVSDVVEQAVVLMRENVLSPQLAFSMHAQPLVNISDRSGEVWAPAALAAARISSFRRLVARHTKQSSALGITTHATTEHARQRLRDWQQQVETILGATSENEPSNSSNLRVVESEREQINHLWTTVSRLLLLARAIVNDTSYSTDANSAIKRSDGDNEI